MQSKNIKKSFLSRWFTPREVMIRKQDRISFCSLSTAKQECFFLIFLILVAWCVFVSGYFLYFRPTLSRTSDELSLLQKKYADLKGEIYVFADYLDSVIAQMDKNKNALEALEQKREQEQPKIRKIDSNELAAQNEDEKIPQNALEQDSLRIKGETELVRERIGEMIDSFRDKADVDDNRLAFHKVLLQRDLAAAETKALQKKVKNLEKLISGMQEAQLLAFRKMASLADERINVVENDLSDIKGSLANVGIGMDSLLRRIRRDKETVGIGGPFIPTPMPKPQHNLNISLVSLNQRLDRWYDLITLQDALPLGKPVERVRVTSPFGSRGDPFQGAPARHEAVDLGGMIGDPVYATAPGKVVRTGSWGWYGNMVEIDHGMGVRTRYAHMEKIFVTKGETVRTGDRIGTLGNTGRSTGPHLHYEIRIRGFAVDPMKFIKAKKNVFKS